MVNLLTLKVEDFASLIRT